MPSEKHAHAGDPATDRALTLLGALKEQRTDEPRLAQPMERLLSRLIDGGIALAALFVIGAAVSIASERIWSSEVGGPTSGTTVSPVLVPDRPVRARVFESAGGGGLFLAFLALPEVAFVAWTGQTIGKRKLQLFVVGRDGRSISWPRAAARFATWGMPVFASASLWAFLYGADSSYSLLVLPAVAASFGIGFWWFCDRDYRGLHDRLGRTNVVTPRD